MATDLAKIEHAGRGSSEWFGGIGVWSISWGS
jgi:hypothetical protein